jgi:phosphocarrier protein FPr/phosphocarrier protein
MSVLSLRSPLPGWSTPLAEVPDPVFAGGMMGDGIAIDPTAGLLCAPCDAIVVSVAPTRHAVTLRADEGAELLLHVGIDTVALAGDGFEALVAAGQRVRTGEPLLRFDLDLVARRAPSLLSPIIVTNAGEFEFVRRRLDCAVKTGELLLELRRIETLAADMRGGSPETAPRPVDAAAGSAGIASRRMRVGLGHGIHARPAALIARRARDFQAASFVLAHGRRASARSAVSLMTLGVGHDDEIEIEARGEGASDAIAAIAALLADAGATQAAGAAPAAGTSPASAATTSSSAPSSPAARVATASGKPAAVHETPPLRSGDVITGVVASRGFAVGRAHVVVQTAPEIVEIGTGVAAETAVLSSARAAVRTRLRAIAANAIGARHEIVEAHLEFLDDPDLEGAAATWIARGKSAAFAWRQAVHAGIETLRTIDDARLKERADDLLDLEVQVLKAIAGESLDDAPVPDGTIIVAAELLPSKLAALDPARIAGLCIASGGPTSHVAIMAAAMGLPTLVSAGPSVMTIEDGAWLILDAEAGLLRVDPPSDARVEAERSMRERHERNRVERSAARADCYTADGVRIEVFANVGSVAEAVEAVHNGAEGCGLLRTEFLFLDRRTAPTVDEQAAEYQQIVDAFGSRPVVIRTLDAGGDKPIDYLPMPREDNPALGLRGVRTSLREPELMRAQLRAILRVRPLSASRIMLPMVNEPDEIRSVRALLDEIGAQTGGRAAVSLGVMVETPAAAMLAERICEVADFVSIGTNDLTQYTLAMDRTHPELAARLDGLHPAVLRLIGRTADAARARNRLVAVCGGLASDPAAARLLIGLGVQELSVVPGSIPRLKAAIRASSTGQCRELARRALGLDSAAAVRALLAAQHQQRPETATTTHG